MTAAWHSHPHRHGLRQGFSPTQHVQRWVPSSLHILSLQLNLLPSHHGTATLHTSSLQRHRPTRNDNVSTHTQRRAAVLWLWNTYTWVCCVGPMRACVCQCASFAAFIIHVGGGSVCTVVCSPMCYVVLCVSCPGTRGGGGTTARVWLVCSWCVDCAWCVVYSCIQKGKKGYPGTHTE